MPSDHIHFVLAQGFREGLGKELSEFQRATTEAGQTTVWLVGISSTLLFLSMLDPSRVAAVAGGRHGTFSFLILLTITAGVVHRLLSLWAVRRTSSQLLQLEGRLMGYTMAARLEGPGEFSASWDENEIVRRLLAHFAVDYTSLLKYPVPLSWYQETYQTQLQQWKRNEDEGMQNLTAVVGAHLGLSEDETRRMFQGSGLDQIRRRGRATRRIIAAASVMFLISATAFVAAMAIVALGLLPHAA